MSASDHSSGSRRAASVVLSVRCRRRDVIQQAPSGREIEKHALELVRLPVDQPDAGEVIAEISSGSMPRLHETGR